MVTPLDIGLLSTFKIIFPFLFIIVIVFATLNHIRPFKDNPVYSLLIAFVLAILTLTSDLVTETINTAAPWFVLLMVFVIFLLITYQAFGIQEKTILEVITGREYGSSFAHWIVAIVLIIVLGSLVSVVSEKEVPEKEAVEVSGPATIWEIITHPQVLGMLAVLLIGLVTVNQLAHRE